MIAFLWPAYKDMLKIFNIVIRAALVTFTFDSFNQGHLQDED